MRGPTSLGEPAVALLYVVAGVLLLRTARRRLGT
jgi:hypothetical protein